MYIRWGRTRLCTHGIVNIGIVYNDIQEICRGSRPVTALVLGFGRVYLLLHVLLTSYLMLNTSVL